MNLNLIILLIVIIFYLLSASQLNQANTKKNLIILACTLLTLQSGLRHVCVGSDTYGYYGSFVSVIETSWTEVFAGFFVNSEEFRDPGYRVVEKIMSLIPSWQFYLLMLAVFYYYSLGRLMYRYIHTKEGVLLAVLLALSLFNIIAMSGMRQQITMALSMFLIPYLEERRWWRVLSVVLIGSVIHISFLFYLLFIPLQCVKFKNYKSLLGISILLIPIILVGARGIVGFMASFLENDYYAGYATEIEQSTPYVYLLMCTFVSIFILVNNVHMKTAPHFFYSAIILMTLTFPLIILNGSLIRIAQYFTIYMMMFLPFVIEQMKDKKIYYLSISAILSIYILTKSEDYFFFWYQNPQYEVSPILTWM